VDSPEAWGKFFPRPPVFDPLNMKIKKAGMSADLLLFLGGAEGDRTPDPKTASLVLSQLSYSPTLFLFKREINLTSRTYVVKKKDGPCSSRALLTAVL
jgi:hypothetical protein